MSGTHIIYGFVVWAVTGLLLYPAAVVSGWPALATASWAGVGASAALIASGIVGMYRGIE